MAKKKKSSKPVDRAAEYIDSPRMTQRLRYQKDISARIAGNYGTYRTQLRIDDQTSANCSCPSEIWPCKHARALQATWKCNPKSFLDLQEVLDKLARQSKPELVALIGQLAMMIPECLSILGVEGFDPDEFDDDFE